MREAGPHARTGNEGVGGGVGDPSQSGLRMERYIYRAPSGHCPLEGSSAQQAANAALEKGKARWTVAGPARHGGPAQREGRAEVLAQTRFWHLELGQGLTSSSIFMQLPRAPANPKRWGGPSP